MKYMLLMNVSGGGPYQIAGWTAADMTAHIAFMRDFGKKLAAAGELVGAEGLSGPDQAKRVRAGAQSIIRGCASHGSSHSRSRFRSSPRLPYCPSAPGRKSTMAGLT